MNPPSESPLNTSPHQCVLDKQLCLILNSSWQPIGVRSVRDAVICLASEAGGQHPAMALDIETATDENGNTTVVSAVPTKWEDWIELPIRESDLYILAAHDRKIRVPTVIVAVNFSAMPLKKPLLSVGNIHERDGHICGYTGKKLTRAELSVDHILPRSRGGRDEWMNLITCHKKVNQLKADKTPQEAGLTLLRKPTAPRALPVSATIKDANRPEWKPFLLRS